MAFQVRRCDWPHAPGIDDEAGAVPGLLDICKRRPGSPEEPDDGRQFVGLRIPDPREWGPVRARGRDRGRVRRAGWGTARSRCRRPLWARGDANGGQHCVGKNGSDFRPSTFELKAVWRRGIAHRSDTSLFAAEQSSAFARFATYFRRAVAIGFAAQEAPPHRLPCSILGGRVPDLRRFQRRRRCRSSVRRRERVAQPEDDGPALRREIGRAHV